MLAALALLVPMAFVAITVKVYSVPFDKLETTQDNEVFETTVTEQVDDPGLEVTL